MSINLHIFLAAAWLVVVRALIIHENSQESLSRLDSSRTVDTVSPLRAWAHKQSRSVQCFQNIDSHYGHRFQALTQFGQEYQQRSVMPGAGIGEIIPFKTVLKDGYLPFECMTDEMYYHGDKFDDHRHAYTMESQNLSIIFYDAVVPKVDQEKMTPEICFDFCRTVPDMGFFGIHNGRKCYCTPFFKRMAGSGAACDAVCEGDSTQICGSKTKSSIFEMHMCSDTLGDLKKGVAKLGQIKEGLTNLTDMLSILATQGEKESIELKDMLSMLGDPAYVMMQKANLEAGKLKGLLQSAQKIEKQIDEASEAGTKLSSSFMQLSSSPDFSDFAKAKEADTVIKQMDSIGKSGKEMIEKVGKVLTLQQEVQTEKVAAMAANRTNTYYHAYYFANTEPYTTKNWGKDKSTCTGELTSDPIFGLSLDECAYACDQDQFEGCTGFYHMAKGAGVCFLLKKIEKITHYDMCSKPLEGECAPTPPKQSSLLEQSAKSGETSTPFPWKTKSSKANWTLYKETVEGYCTRVTGCSGDQELSDCSIMKDYMCEEYNEMEVTESGGVLNMFFAGWLEGWGGDKNNACSVNPVPCETCKKYKTCSGPYAETEKVLIKKGDVASYTWTSSGQTDNYEVFVGLYSETCGLVDFQFQRGEKQDWKTFELYAPKTDKYYVKFLLASYDGTGGGAIGADMQVKEVKQTKATVPRVFSIDSQCMLKFASYSGVNLLPDRSGERKNTVKEATKRCLKPDGTFPLPEDYHK